MLQLDGRPRAVGHGRATLVAMSPRIGTSPSPLRYLLVPLVLLLVGAIMMVSRQGAESRLSAAPGARPTASEGVTGDAAPAADGRLAPQGGTADGRVAVAYDRLVPGECFDIDRAEPGTVVRRGCDRPHDAQLVTVLRLMGDHRTDEDIRDAAATLCREPLHRKAARQPSGTRWTTFVQYPYRSSYLLGSDTVACSLTAYTRPGAAARPLTAPLL
ncbi:hypothetical protein [Streptomyces sp. NPDC096030]|uniref:hypothetical protein n=1 Tax=Streptomyces sp. NPDC096030 TaxID=3155423 RepID=UPI0033319040